MRLIDADALEVVGTVIPSDIDAKSYVIFSYFPKYPHSFDRSSTSSGES